MRNLGFAVFVVLALTASAGVASASASGFEADEYPAILHGEVPGAELQQFKLGSISTGCNPTLDGTIESASKAVTAAMGKGTSCEYVEISNCELVLHPGSESKGQFNGTFDLMGAKCLISIVRPSCSYKAAGPQSGLTATYTNVGEKSAAHIKIAINTSLTYTSEGLCGSGTKTGEWFGNWEVSAKNIAGESTGLHVVANPLTGLYLAGGNFQAESYPLTVAGDQVATPVLSMKSLSTTCENTHLETTALSSSSVLGPISAEYVGCSVGAGIYKTLIDMNSCHYALNAAGTLNVTCNEKGDAIEVTVRNATDTALKCLITIGPQEGLKGVGYTNVGEGNGRGIKVELGIEGMSYATKGTKLNCGGSEEGTHNDGKYSGAFTLYGGV